MINISIIGTSEISKIYIKSFQKLGINISTIYSRDINRAKNISHQFNIKNFTNKLEEILIDKTINAAIIVTEPNRHLDLANDLLLNNKNVLIEKPIDIDFIKSKNFLEKFRKTDKIIDVVSQNKFNPIIIKFKNQFKLQNKSNPGFFNLKIFYKKDKKYFLDGNQWKRKFSNPIINQGIHWIDLINEIFGEIIEFKSMNSKYSKFVENEDNILAILKYQNNKFVSISASTNIKNNRDYFSYHSSNYFFSYKKEFYKYLLIKPYNFWKIKHSYMIFLQCKNFIDNIKLKRNQKSIEYAVKNLELAEKIIKISK